MGWHIGMSEEEMREFAGMPAGASCPLSSAKKNQAPAPKAEGSSSHEFDDSTSIDSPPIKSIIVETETATPATTSTSDNTACPLPPSSLPPPPPPNVDFIYHLCQKSKWEEAINAKLPYFPPTYMKDGKFTRASVKKEDIVGVANLYYKDVPGKFIVLEIKCRDLYALGIPILSAEAPETILTGQPTKCLQIFGGISTSLPLVNSVYPIFRRSADGHFIRLLEPLSTPKESKPPKPSKKDKKSVEKIESPEQPQKQKDKKKRGLLGRLKKPSSSRNLKV